MVSSFFRTSRTKTKIFAAVIGPVFAALVLFGLFVLRGQTSEAAPNGTGQTDQASPGLGITYLNVTPAVSAYYRLGVQYGALVTEVVPGSPACLAGVETGDVILSFNGTRLGEDVSLLGMMMACPEGDMVQVEVWRVDYAMPLELLHVSEWEAKR
ncbi:MAG: hypothetical protein A2Z29_03780 [Chloroflexi bacterium RBG_16_56_11]|nr:MAG: hypothetical protein A2Z29_03780 [Chloroflexi bacterium RBG_16_56_11]